MLGGSRLGCFQAIVQQSCAAYLERRCDYRGNNEDAAQGCEVIPRFFFFATDC